MGGDRPDRYSTKTTRDFLEMPSFRCDDAHQPVYTHTHVQHSALASDTSKTDHSHEPHHTQLSLTERSVRCTLSFQPHIQHTSTLPSFFSGASSVPSRKTAKRLKLRRESYHPRSFQFINQSLFDSTLCTVA